MFCVSHETFFLLLLNNCRLKKLIDLEALGLSRLSVLLIDLHVDVKGYSLLTLPQVRYHFGLVYYCPPVSVSPRITCLIHIHFPTFSTPCCCGSDEFWDLYKNYFHQRLLDGSTRICLYGSIQRNTMFFRKKRVPKE